MSIQARLAKVAQLLNDGNKTEKELLNLYANLKNEMAKLDDQAFESVKEIYEQLVGEFENNLRIRFPKAAKKLYGAKDLEVREKLTKTLTEMTLHYPLEQSVLENKVKTGGDMIAGRKYLCVYISFKNSDQKCCFLGASQISILDPLTWNVISYTAYLKPSDAVIKSFDGQDYNGAVAYYQDLLVQLIQ